MTVLMQANRQWRTRPSDERFMSLLDLDGFANKQHQMSKQRVLSTRQISCEPVEGDSKALVATGPNGGAVTITHWSFGQLARVASANRATDYLRTLPGPLAADCLNYGLQTARSAEDVQVLLRQNGGPAELAAVTGPNYGRIWNSTLTRALVDQFGDGVTGTFRVPGNFGIQVPITKQNSTLYASDRDMFVFLADEKNRIEIPDRRNGRGGSLARGIFAWNSEVGSSTLGLATFFYDYVCSNRIVWGARQYAEVRIRHTSSAPDRWLEECMPAIEAYRTSSTKTIVAAIEDTRKKRIDDIDEFLTKRFFYSKSTASAIRAAHMTDEQRPIETLWDAAVGISAYARGIQHQDVRVRIERDAGKILDMVFA